MAAVQCVLLGVAEVKVPIKRLPQEMLTKVAEVAYWTVLHEGQEVSPKKDCPVDRESFIGEVDKYYSLREVEVRVNEEKEECQIVHSDNVILQHNTKDVATVIPLKDFFRVVYISKSDSFGRTAVVLDLKSEEARQQLFALFPNAARPPQPSPSSRQVLANLLPTLIKKIKNMPWYNVFVSLLTSIISFSSTVIFFFLSILRYYFSAYEDLFT